MSQHVGELFVHVEDEDHSLNRLAAVVSLHIFGLARISLFEVVLLDLLEFLHSPRKYLIFI
jgi:hypothetical protein